MNEETERYLPYDSIQYLDKKKHIEIWGSKLPHCRISFESIGKNTKSIIC